MLRTSSWLIACLETSAWSLRLLVLSKNSTSRSNLLKSISQNKKLSNNKMKKKKQSSNNNNRSRSKSQNNQTLPTLYLILPPTAYNKRRENEITKDQDDEFLSNFSTAFTLNGVKLDSNRSSMPSQSNQINYLKPDW